MKNAILLVLAMPVLFIMAFLLGLRIPGKMITVKTPDGMAYIPSGTLLTGPTYENTGKPADNRSVVMYGMYMDKTEVTNQQYKEFTDWVRDSIALAMLGKINDSSNSVRAFQKQRKLLDWGDPSFLSTVLPMLATGKDGKRTVNQRKLVYHYSVFDQVAYSKHKNENYLRFISTFDIPVYPYGNALKSASNGADYFEAMAFADYPVTGINVLQCRAYCNWRAQQWNKTHDTKNFECEYRLPTEEEWEWAARGGNSNNAGITDLTGFAGLGAPAKVGAAEANGYGLMNMKNGMPEWTSTFAYDNEAGTGTDYFSRKEKGAKYTLMVLRGGMATGGNNGVQARRVYAMDSANAHVGFRCMFTVVHNHAE